MNDDRGAVIMRKAKTAAATGGANVAIPGVAHEKTAEEKKKAASASRRQRVRKAFGVLVILGMIYVPIHIIFFTSLLDPLLGGADGVLDRIQWFIDHPDKALLAAAALVIPHIGAYYMIFENQ